MRPVYAARSGVLLLRSQQREELGLMRGAVLEEGEEALRNILEGRTSEKVLNL
jgi:hypothetical protein